LPQEIEVWYVIPTIRKELALALKRQGLSQKQIAAKLDLTEAAVSQYINKKRAAGIPLPSKLKQEIEKSAIKIVKNGSVVKEISHILELSRKELFLCKVHKRHGVVRKGCEDCLLNK